MTREEFKKHIRNLFYSSKTVEKYLEQAYTDIDKIYNDHEAQLKAKNERIRELEEAMKPKTCEGCSNLFFDEIEKVYKCSNDVSDDVGYLHGEAVIRNIKDFHCVQHQPKDNK